MRIMKLMFYITMIGLIIIIMALCRSAALADEYYNKIK